MRIRSWNLFLIAALLLGMLPMTWAPQQNTMAATPAIQSPTASAATAINAAEPELATPERQIPPHVQELSAAELADIETMTAEEFVAQHGYLPRALEDKAAGRSTMLVIELEKEPLAAIYAQRQTMTADAIESYVAGLEATQAQLETKLEGLGVQVVSNYTTVYNGFLAQVPLDQVNAIRALPGVVGIHRAPQHVPALGSSVPIIGAPDVWEDLGFDGDGIVIAIVDTGIDYTHIAFDGSGDPDDYTNNDPDIIEAGTFPTAKVVAGYDFAGTTYNADPDSAGYQPVPHPDQDPLDENSHGTHVASIAAGLSGGQVMTGTAPGASLMALKVFGASGSTNLVMDALDVAAFNYIFNGWPQVINMSLGSSYGPGNDPNDADVIATNNAVSAGIVVVASAGNSGNITYSTGSPGNADKAIGVAGSTTGWVTGPTASVDGSTSPTLTNIIYMPPAFSPDGHYLAEMTAPLAYAGAYSSKILCVGSTVSPTNAFVGKIVLIERGTCAFTEKVRTAKSFGAVGVLVYNNAANGNTYVTMADDGLGNLIPAGFLAYQDGLYLQTANTQSVTVSAENDVSTVIDRYVPADSVYPSSSRGPRGTDSRLKPEIAAPGYNIFAAAMGTGVEGASFSGTSMASPHVAGVAALMVQAHPDWTPEQIKAAMMNTAVDLVDGTAIPRQGAGRVDAYRAVDTPVFAVGDADFVSISDMFVTNEDEVIIEREITLYNTDAVAHDFAVDWDYQGASLAGVEVTVPANVTVNADSELVVPVTFTFDVTALPAIVGTLEQIYGYILFTPADPDDTLRVPFYFVARPYNELDITAQTVITDTAADMATFEITHSGPITSSLWAFPLLVSDAAETNTSGDIKAVGIDYGWNHATYGPILSIAIDAWGPWHLPHYYFTEFDIWVDINEDGANDYVIYNAPVAGTDRFIPTIVNLTTGVSRTSVYYMYVDFNSGYMELYVPAAYLGLSATNPNFDFQVMGYTYGGGEDISAPGRFDYARYPFAWGATTLEPGPAAPNATVGVWVNNIAGYTYSQPEGAMIVDYTGNPDMGGEVYLYDITLPDINTFSILHTNDFHGNLEPAGSNPGIARTAKVINNVRSAVGADNVLLVDAGDEMQGSLLSNLSDGAATIDLFNFVGYQAATFGNHEFDWGQTVLEERMDQADYPFLATNLVINDTGNCATAGWTHPDYVQPWTTMTVGDPGNEVVVGLIGVTSQETPYITVASATDGLCFKEATESISHYYDAVVAAGAEVLVIISHLGNVDGGYGYGIPVYGDQTLARNLINAGKPVDLIIGGHSHTNLSAAQIIEVAGMPGKTYVVQAHYAGRRVGRADIAYNRTDDTVAINWQSLAVSTSGEQDAATLARLNTWAQDPNYLSLINTVIGYTNVSLTRRSTLDNTMGAFVNDAIYYELNGDAEPLNDVDMVFNNSGGLRADIIATGAPTVPYTLTYGALFSVLPFGNQTVVGDMTGAQIMELLNQSATLFKGTLQIAGIRFKYYSYGAPDTFDAYHNTWWAWGAYDVEVKNGATWEPLEMDRVYRVGTNEFLAPAGQDGFAPFKYMTNISYWGDMLNQVISWTSANYGTPATAYNQGLDGRIIREGDNSSGPIVPVTLLHHNDSHGRLVPSGSAPGYTNLATLIRQEWQNNPDRTILLHAGDTIQGDAMAAFYKAAFTGKGADGTDLPPELWINPILRAMNAMTYTAMTLGNHEYNFGGHIFTGTLGQANFPLLQANVYDDGSYGLAEVNVQPHLTVTVGPENISLAILGIGNHRIPIYELPSNIPGLTFTNPISETQDRAPALKAANDAVIALTHIGFTEDPKSVEVDANVDTNLAAVTTGVDVIIGSHSHTNPTTGYGDYKYLPAIVGSADNVPVLINQAYRYNTFLGEVVLGMRAKAGGGYEVAARAGKAVPVTTSIPEDPTVKAIITPYNDFLTTYRTRILGQTIIPIDSLNAYTAETNAANLQADASVWKLQNELPVEIDFHLSGAMTNGKIANPATPTTPYTLTVGDMFTLMPYENSLLVMEINGAQLKQILERGYRNYWYYYYKDDDTPRWGGYSHYTTCMLDVSAGAVITYTDPGESMLPNGNNVAAMSVNGVPIDFTEATTYTVSTVNYLAAGSCNFNNSGVTLWPLDQIVFDTQYYVRDVVIEYIPTLTQPINPQIEGRLVFNAFTQTTGLVVAPATDAKEGLEDTVVEYTLHITNTGNMADTFLLSYAGVWDVDLPASIIVQPNTMADVTVQVMIPAGAVVGATDVTTVTVKSQASPTTEGQAILTTSVVLQAGALELTILHTNDFHGRVDEYQTSGARCPTPGDAGCIAGSPRIATLVDQYRAAEENVLVLDTGDQFQGTLFYNLYKSEVIAEMMNAIGYDAMAVGNHEFDDGPDELAALIDAVNFPVLAANIKVNIYNLYLPLVFKESAGTVAAEAAPVTAMALPGSSLLGKLVPYTIVERDGQEVAIVGLTTPETESISSAGPNIEFLDPIETLRATVYDLTSTHSVDKIIVLAHQGYDADQLMAAAVSGVDVIIGGHSHTFLYTGTPPTSLTPAGPYPTVVNSPAGEPVLVVTAYQWGTYLGHLDVTFDPNGVITDYAGNPIYVANSVPKKVEVETLLEPYRAGVADLIATEVGTITVAAPINVGGARICRLGECLMGNLVADAMLWKAKQAEPAAGYQIAVTNGGGLRAPLITGTVTMGDVMEVLPFGNTLATMGLTGADLLAALEHSARLYPSENGGFLQVSGMKYTFDPAQPAGSRITAAEVWNGAAYEAIVPTTVYKVVTNNFTRNGGDGYVMFRDNAINPYDFGPDLAATLAEYFETFSPVTPLIQGRIIRVAR